MGSVYNRGSRAKPNWWIKWIDRRGKQAFQKIGPDRTLAKAVLAKIEHEIIAKKNDVHVGPPPEIPLFSEAADAFIVRRSALGVEGRPMRRSWRDDRGRLDLHLRPHLGHLRLDEITDDLVRKLIDRLRQRLKPQTVRNCLALVSRIYNEQPRAMRLENPVALLDRADRDAIGPAWDPKATPFLKTEQVTAVYLAFPELSVSAPWRAMFACGAFAGLRPGEVLALEWGDIDFNAGTIHVRRSVDGPLKDDESRIAPIAETLAIVLKQWRKLMPVGVSQLFRPTGRGGRRRANGRQYVKDHSIGAALRTALTAAKVPPMTWYSATRHTFASRYVQAGGSLLKLSLILGHSAAETTLRYAHLQPGNFTDHERNLVNAPIEPAKVLELQNAG